MPEAQGHILVRRRAKDGRNGKDGRSSFKSMVFVRQNTPPAVPSGGSYSNPIPDGWSDGIPGGEEMVWMSTRVFTADGEPPQQREWTNPIQMTDTSDFDVEYSSYAYPDAPSGHPNVSWGWTDTPYSDAIWLATSTKRNGVWSEWVVSKIKGDDGAQGPPGEKGDDGAQGPPGEKGDDGAQGAILRTSEWTEGVEYRNDTELNTTGIRYLDIAVITGVGGDYMCYECINTHTASAANKPFGEDYQQEAWGEYWRPFNMNKRPVFTPLIMAQYGLIRFSQTNRLLVDDSSRNAIVAGMGGGQIPLWVGSETPETAPFRVDINGTAHIDGTVNAKEGRIGGFIINGYKMSADFETKLNPWDPESPAIGDDTFIEFNDPKKGRHIMMGTNVLPDQTGATAFFIAENSAQATDQASINNAIYIGAMNAVDNIALTITGGCISGLAYRTQEIMSGYVTSKNVPVSYSPPQISRSVMSLFVSTVFYWREKETDERGTPVAYQEKTRDVIITLPDMRECDDGHVIKIKRGPNNHGAVKIYPGASIRWEYSSYTGKIEKMTGKAFIYYDGNSFGTEASDTPLILNSEGDATELIYHRNIKKQINGSEYHGCWVQYKHPRAW